MVDYNKVQDTIGRYVSDGVNRYFVFDFHVMKGMYLLHNMEDLELYYTAYRALHALYAVFPD